MRTKQQAVTLLLDLLGSHSTHHIALPQHLLPGQNSFVKPVKGY
jgi:hypothetical protein